MEGFHGKTQMSWAPWMHRPFNHAQTPGNGNHGMAAFREQKKACACGAGLVFERLTDATALASHRCPIRLGF